ncbi:Asp-tRNA(Asn)/Glu-tRNA(Gln) amidotransferase subunit GatB [Candidatus Saccharibacteria bacterium]|nr:Asp-tRNA(Asn)/Glu-tRNA(Gln) amidotransferase subunit GatB [Candidatus Saccharibacteria bacterium]
MNPQLRSKYEVVIGIECHVQLATKTKLFCSCGNDARDAEPNTLVCEVCMGMPGALPVLNKHAVELALRLGIALNAEYKLPYHMKFDRKNYFYPDSPKGYQITQFDEPVVPNGFIEFPVDGKMTRIGITRAHLEGDAGKLTHPEGANYSLVDLNRAETPLVEIVSEPDMRSAAEAKAYAQELYNIVRYAAVSDANLYYGNMRFDVNVSVRPVGQAEFGTRSETKNLNSFKAIERAVEYEVRRQIVLVEGGDKVKQETRGWNDDKLETYSMRSKEDADEYRYFPEPDLPPIIVTKAMVTAAAAELSLLPADLRKQLATAKLPAAESEVLVADPVAAGIWHQVALENPAEARFALNWLIGDRIKLEETKQQPLAQSQITSLPLALVGSMVREGKLSSSNAKILLEHLWGDDTGANEVAAKLGLIQQSDEGELGKIIDSVLLEQAKIVDDYKSGNERAFGALVGAAMKASKGQGNPQLFTKLLKQKLS